MRIAAISPSGELTKNLKRILVRQNDFEMVGEEDEPDVLFIDISELETGFEMAETFKASHESEIILVSDKIREEYFRRAMQVGARDLLIKPLNSEEVLESLAKINDLRKKNKKGVQGNDRARIITVFSTKGGVGKTTIATNTAVCLEKNTGKKVAVVDLDLEFGCMAAMFGLRPNPNIVDLCNTDGPLDSELVEKILQLPVMTKAKVLVAPPTPDLAAVVEGDGRKDKNRNYVSEIISILEKNYDYIIIDTASNFRETNLTALDRSDKILLV
ncbi:MAG: pilus assembly protein CpaE, partial [Thermosediminibacterales bacterium]|nr:pilus assembly protein CpaE [Thermosediminibacterales bacterium]